MEAISQALQPYKDIVGNVASIVTISQFLSGILICKEIYEAKSTKGKSAIPFVGGVVLGFLMMQYAFILDDKAMKQVNYAGLALNVLYMLCYYIYADDKNDLMRPLSYGSAIVAACYAYTKLEDPDLIEHRLGLIITIGLFTLIASPLFSIRTIIEKRNAETMPMPIIFSGTLVASLWLLYGIILLNNFMIIQNIVGLGLSVIQILVYIFFRGGTEDTKKTKEAQAKKAD